MGLVLSRGEEFGLERTVGIVLRLLAGAIGEAIGEVDSPLVPLAGLAAGTLAVGDRLLLVVGCAIVDVASAAGFWLGTKNG